MTKVGIITSDEQFYSSLDSLLTKDKKIEKFTLGKDYENINRCYNEKKPDVLILDVDTNIDEGIHFIDELSQSLVEGKKRNVILTYSETNPTQNFRFSNVYSSLSKDLPEKVVETIKEMVSTNIVVTDCHLTHQLHDLFFKINFPVRRNNGSLFVENAIIDSYRNESFLRTPLDILYGELSKEINYKIDKKHIKWDINNTMRYKTFDRDVYYSAFSYGNGNSFFDGRESVGTKYFISICVAYLKYVNK